MGPGTYYLGVKMLRTGRKHWSRQIESGGRVDFQGNGRFEGVVAKKQRKEM